MKKMEKWIRTVPNFQCFVLFFFCCCVLSKTGLNPGNMGIKTVGSHIVKNANIQDIGIIFLYIYNYVSITTGQLD